MKHLAIDNGKDLIFGYAPRSVKCGHDVTIGGGEVYLEINFTLPQMTIDERTWPEIRKQYSEMIEEICQRAVNLQAPALVVEFELLLPMTLRPEWGGEISEILSRALEHYYRHYGLRSVLRATPVDVRDNARPPQMRSGQFLEKTLKSLACCAETGADLLAIESTGGKEVHDEALINSDLSGILG